MSHNLTATKLDEDVKNDDVHMEEESSPPKGRIWCRTDELYPSEPELFTDEKQLLAIIESKSAQFTSLLTQKTVVTTLMNIDAKLITPATIQGLGHVLSIGTMDELTTTQGAEKAKLIQNNCEMILGNFLMQMVVDDKKQHVLNVDQGTQILLGLFETDKNARALNCMVQNLLALGDYDNALLYVEKYLNDNPDKMSNQLLRGFVKKENKNLDIKKLVSIIHKMDYKSELVQKKMGFPVGEDPYQITVMHIAQFMIMSYISDIVSDLKTQALQIAFDSLPKEHRLGCIFQCVMLMPVLCMGSGISSRHIVMMKEMLDSKMLEESTKEYLFAMTTIETDANLVMKSFISLYNMCTEKGDKIVARLMYDMMKHTGDTFEKIDQTEENKQFLEMVERGIAEDDKGDNIRMTNMQIARHS